MNSTLYIFIPMILILLLSIVMLFAKNKRRSVTYVLSDSKSLPTVKYLMVLSFLSWASLKLISHY